MRLSNLAVGTLGGCSPALNLRGLEPGDNGKVFPSFNPAPPPVLPPGLVTCLLSQRSCKTSQNVLWGLGEGTQAKSVGCVTRSQATRVGRTSLLDWLLEAWGSGGPG